MPYQGNGIYLPTSLPGSWNPAVAGQPATPGDWNTLLADLTTALSSVITSDGQSTITQNIPLNNKKITGLGVGTASTDAATLGQLQGSATGVSDTGAVNAYVIAPSPAITGYVLYQSFQFVAAHSNTAASTLAVSGLAAKAIVHLDGTALLADDILVNEMIAVQYDGTQFQLLAATGLRGMANTWRAAQTFAAAVGASAVVTMSGAAVNEARGTAIASAGTTDIGAAAGNYVHITGTTTITALGPIQAGTRRKVVFDGALLITHNATSLILPTGANITTAAGDCAEFESEGSGNWRCTDYARASGQPLVPYVPPQTAQAFVTIAAGVATVQKQSGFTSVVRTALGKYECTLSVAMPDLNYVVAGSSGSDPGVGTNAALFFEVSNTSRTTTVFHLGTLGDNVGYQDADWLSIKVFA